MSGSREVQLQPFDLPNHGCREKCGIANIPDLVEDRIHAGTPGLCRTSGESHSRSTFPMLQRT